MSDGINGPLHALTFTTGDGDIETAIATMSCVCGWKHEFPVGLHEKPTEEIHAAIKTVIREHSRAVTA